MNDVTKDLLEALKAAQAYVCGPTAWTQEQEDTLVEAMSKAIARAEASLAEPKPDADGWIRWDGFHFPIQDGVAHQVRFRDGEVSEVDYEASGWPWMHDGDDSDIVAYRVAGESK